VENVAQTPSPADKMSALPLSLREYIAIDRRKLHIIAKPAQRTMLLISIDIYHCFGRYFNFVPSSRTFVAFAQTFGSLLPQLQQLSVQINDLLYNKPRRG